TAPSVVFLLPANRTRRGLQRGSNRGAPASLRRRRHQSGRWGPAGLLRRWSRFGGSGASRPASARIRAVFEVETRSLPGRPTAVGSADTFTLVVDRPVDGGGGGLGFNGGRLVRLARPRAGPHNLSRA